MDTTEAHYRALGVASCSTVARTRRRHILLLLLVLKLSELVAGWVVVAHSLLPSAVGRGIEQPLAI